MSCGTGGRALAAAHILTGLADSHRSSGRPQIDTYRHVLSGMAGGRRKRWTRPYADAYFGHIAAKAPGFVSGSFAFSAIYQDITE
jgi:hypothetical protein